MIVTGTGGKLNKQLSVSKDAILMTSYTDNFASMGERFTYRRVLSFGAAEIQNILIDMSAMSEKKEFTLSPIIGSASEDMVEARVYEGTDYTGGTSLQFYNANRNYGDRYDTVITTGATGTVKGTNIREILFPGNSSGKNIRPASNNSLVSLILDRTQKYLIELESANTTDFELNIDFYEVVVSE